MSEKLLPQRLLEYIGAYAQAVERHATGETKHDLDRLAAWEALIDGIKTYANPTSPEMSDGELVARAVVNGFGLLVALKAAGGQFGSELCKAGMKDGEILQAELDRRAAARRAT